MCIHRSNTAAAYDDIVPSYMKDELGMPQRFEDLKSQQQHFLLDFYDAVRGIVTHKAADEEVLNELLESEHDLEVTLHSIQSAIYMVKNRGK
jgi:hypothetical protein